MGITEVVGFPNFPNFHYMYYGGLWGPRKADSSPEIPIIDPPSTPNRGALDLHRGIEYRHMAG